MPDNKVKLSVIVPVYNVEDYLARCLDSLINQPLNEIEIICINDGSTDKSKDILEKYAALDTRIIIINQHNQGLGISRNNGMKYATGEYIAFIDSDDWIEQNMFQLMYDKARKLKSDVVLCEFFVHDFYSDEISRPPMSVLPISNEFENQSLHWKEFKRDFFKINETAWNKIFRIDFIKELRAEFGEYRPYEDVQFTYHAILKAERVSFIKHPLYHYYFGRKSSLTFAQSDNKYINTITFLNYVENVIKSIGSDKILMKKFNDYKLFKIIEQFNIMDESRQKFLFSDVKEQIKDIDIANAEDIFEEFKIEAKMMFEEYENFIRCFREHYYFKDLYHKSFDSYEEIQKRIEIQEDYINDLKQHLNIKDKTIDDIKNTLTWKLGLLFTKIPWKLYQFVIRLLKIDVIFGKKDENQIEIKNDEQIIQQPEQIENLGIEDSFEKYEGEFLENNKTIHQRYREIVEDLKPDIIVSFMPHHFKNVVYALKDFNTPVIVSHHTEPDYYCYNPQANSQNEIGLRLKSVKMSALSTVLIDEFVDFFPEELRPKTIVTPNCVRETNREFSSETERQTGVKTILNVARVAEEKNHELLLRAFALIKDKYPDWVVKIFGPDYTNFSPKVESLIKELKLENQVFLMGIAKDIFSEFEKSQIFAFPSISEGWPLALAESMTFGLPNLVIKECLPTRVHVERGNCGFAVATEPAEYAKHLEILMNDPQLRKSLGKNGQEYVKQFHPHNIFTMWENLLRDISKVENDKKMNIVLTTYSLCNITGGVERVVVDVANEMHLKGHKVSIINDQINITKDDVPFFDLIPEIPIYNIHPFAKPDKKINTKINNGLCTPDFQSDNGEIKELHQKIESLEKQLSFYRSELSQFNGSNTILN